MYQGSEAYRLDASEGALAQQSPRSSFEVVEGRGLDARARQGLSPVFVSRLRAVAIVAIAVMALAVVRVGMFAATVSLLSDNASMRAELKDARATTDELRIEQSILSGSQRIERIATKAYGMVPASGSEQMSAGSAQAAEESADASAPASSGDSASADASAPASAAGPDAASADDATASALAASSASSGDGSSAGSNAADVDSLA